MKKKLPWMLLCFGFVTCAMPLSYAGAMTSKSDGLVLSHGAYIGGELGYDSATMNYPFLFSFTTSHGPSTLDGKNHSVATGFVGGGFIGYAQMLTSKLYLGVELLANGSTASTTNEAVYDHSHDTGLYDSDGYRSTISFKNNVGVSLLPGILINQTVLFYGRLGYSYAHINGNEGVIFYSQPSGLPKTITPYTFNASPNGFSYGLGIEFALIQHVSVRGEFIHSDYQSITTRLNNRITISDNQAMIGLLYHFT